MMHVGLKTRSCCHWYMPVLFLSRSCSPLTSYDACLAGAAQQELICSDNMLQCQTIMCRLVA